MRNRAPREDLDKLDCPALRDGLAHTPLKNEALREYRDSCCHDPTGKDQRGWEAVLFGHVKAYFGLNILVSVKRRSVKESNRGLLHKMFGKDWPCFVDMPPKIG